MSIRSIIARPTPEGLQIIRTDWRKCTQGTWASHLLPWTTHPATPLPATLR